MLFTLNNYGIIKLYSFCSACKQAKNIIVKTDETHIWVTHVHIIKEKPQSSKSLLMTSVSGVLDKLMKSTFFRCFTD